MRTDALLAEAISSHQRGQLGEAEASYRAVLRLDPRNFTAMHHLGVIALGQNKLDKARDLIKEALAMDGSSSEAHNNLGNVLRALRKPEDAILSYKRATQLNPRNAGALSNCAAALMDQNKYAEAIEALEKAVELDPNFVEAHYNLGSAYGAVRKYERAIAEYRAAIRLAPSLFLPYVNLGSLLSELGDQTEAAEALQKATDLQPNPGAFNALGMCYHRAGRTKEAEECFRRAVQLRPDFVEALGNLGVHLALQGRREEATELFRAALRINPNFVNAVANLFFEQRHLCDWQDFDATQNRLRELVRAGARISPFSFITANTTPDEQLICARNWAAPYTSMQTAAISPAARRPGRIRIGYLSCDFKEHATAFLIAEMLERHDHQRFEVFAYSFNADDGSEIRRRLVAAFDHFVDVRAMSHEAAIRRIRDDGVDILVDLKGYTQDARTEIMAGRPAPIQVAYLGYPGTMGADWIDYMIADHFVVPADQRRHFSEKLVYLPHCYQTNDTKRTVSSLGLTRRQFGLPEEGFVFCSFNGNYKITPSIFDVWMRLLKKTPGSVLWLLETGTRVNLLREAQARGVDPQRIVFAPGLVHSQHLERMALADLFLDSLPVNAHTTASDALWAGLPLLTCAGKAFVGRVAGSILHTIGLPELVTHSLDEYEAKALHLAQNPAELRALRDRLSRNKLTSPLFDIVRYTRNLESAYQIMFDRWRMSHSPDAISVEEEAPAHAQELPLAQEEAKYLDVIAERVSSQGREENRLNAEDSDPSLTPAATGSRGAPIFMNGHAGRGLSRTMIDQMAIYQINLDHRADRWAECLQNHAKIGLAPGIVQRVSAVRCENFGALGCAKSHLKALTAFLTEDVREYCLILEDDFDLAVNFGCFIERMEAVNQSGLAWDVLLLSSTKAIAFDSHIQGVQKVFESLAAQAYLVRRAYVHNLIKCFLDAVTNLEEHKDTGPRELFVSRFAIDVSWHELQRTDSWYVFSPGLGNQRPSYSDIEGGFVDYSGMPGVVTLG
jgi:predicted O-linked N-acetylglucosamine transferase (SPINDLY family)